MDPSYFPWSKMISRIVWLSSQVLVASKWCFIFFYFPFSEITYYRWTFSSSSSFWQEMWSWKLDCCFCSRWFILCLVTRTSYSETCSVVPVPKKLVRFFFVFCFLFLKIYHFSMYNDKNILIFFFETVRNASIGEFVLWIVWLYTLYRLLPVTFVSSFSEC